MLQFVFISGETSVLKAAETKVLRFDVIMAKMLREGIVFFIFFFRNLLGGIYSMLLFTEATPFFLIAFAQSRNPQDAQAGIRTQDLPKGRQAC